MKPNVLIQFDPDPHASTFDSVVAIDSGVDHLLVQSGVEPVVIESLVHGAMFTRGGDDLKHTALFFGGSNVEQTEALVQKTKQTFFGPVRVSLMSDPNGSNTTAAAAVLSAQKHLNLNHQNIVVLAGTGPVGLRIAQILYTAAQLTGTQIRLCSRQLNRAQSACDRVRQLSENSDVVGKEISLKAFETGSPDQTLAALEDASVVFAAGAAGVELLDDRWQQSTSLKIAIDLNAVPPAGIAGIEVTDKGTDRHGVTCYGAIGVGGLKMKIHKKCLQQLFQANDQVLETESIYQVGQRV